MQQILIKQNVRFLGVGYAVTGKPLPVEDDVAGELIKLGFAEAAATDSADPGNDANGSADHGQDDAADEQPEPNHIHQKSLFAAPENKALPVAPENKQEE